MNNPFSYSKTKLNWIVSDVNILYRDSTEGGALSGEGFRWFINFFRSG